MDERLKKQLDFILEVDKVKNIFRQTYLADGNRKENDAEHSWHLALMAVLLKEYSNEEVDQLLADYKSETDEDKRTEIVQRVQEILAQDVPAYYIQDPITIYVTDSAVTGFQLYPIDIYELKDISLGQ